MNLAADPYDEARVVVDDHAATTTTYRYKLFPDNRHHHEINRWLREDVAGGYEVHTFEVDPSGSRHFLCESVSDATHATEYLYAFFAALKDINNVEGWLANYGKIGWEVEFLTVDRLGTRHLLLAR